jgi:hypothetical protein
MVVEQFGLSGAMTVAGVGSRCNPDRGQRDNEPCPYLVFSVRNGVWKMTCAMDPL